MGWGDTLSKKICKYLLQRYIGQFLEEKLKLEQLNVDITNGKGTAESVTLSCEVLNQLCEDHGLDVLVTKGYIGFVTVTIPWHNISTAGCYIEVGQLYVAVTPIQRKKCEATSMLESMWSSMSSSMQLAQDCFETEGEEIGQSNAIDGLQSFAISIENFLKRVKVKFVDTTIKVEYISEDEETGVAIIINIESIEYANEAGPNAFREQESATNENEQKKEDFSLPAYTSHNVKFTGITFYTEEFHTNNDDEKFAKCFQYSSQEHYMHQNAHNGKWEPSSIVNQHIPFAKMFKDMEIRIKMKEVENVTGPKVELELTLGTLMLFMTPRQVHMITFLLQSLKENTRNVDKRQHELDFDHQNISVIPNSAYNQEWINSTDILDNNICFASAYDTKSSCDNESFISFTSSMESSISSVSTNHYNKNRKRKINMDSQADISHIQIRLSFVAVTILHDDVSVKCDMKEGLCPCKIRELQQKAEEFFIKAQIIDRLVTSTSIKEMEKISCIIQQSLDCHNLLLVLTPVIVSGEERKNGGEVTMKFSLSIAYISLVEDLNDYTVPLLEFTKNIESNVSLPLALTVNYEQTKHFSRRNEYDQSGRSISKKTCIELAPFEIELDISIIDRIGVLLYNRPFKSKMFTADIHAVCKDEITVNAELVEIKIKFPVTDFRPAQDHSENPWWNRNIRSDFLVLSAQNMVLYKLGASFSIKGSQCQLFYCEKEKSEKVEITRICTNDNIDTKGKSKPIQLEILVNYIPSEAKDYNYMDSKVDKSSNTKENYCYSERIVSSPFSAKKVLRESETCHFREATDDPESFIMPGDNIEMQNFYDWTIRFSKLHIEINFPIVAFQLRSKAMYEKLYNRINSDLMLWQPKGPSLKKVDGNHIILQDIAQEESENVSYPDLTKTNMKQDNVKRGKNALHESTIKINIGTGVVTLYAPVRDAAEEIISSHVGEFVFKTSNSCLFLVNGYNDNLNSSVICLNTKSLEMYHCGFISTVSISSELQFGNIQKHLKATIYPTPQNLCQQQPKSCANRDAISVAVEIEKQPNCNLKYIKVSVGVQTVTLRYFTENVQYAFYTQLHDMFSVLDYPVHGYQPLSNIIELHIHFWDCSIDYRPLNLPYRAVIKKSTVMVSSNITSDVQECTLRFVADDSTLSLAPLKNNEQMLENHIITVLPPKDLVCVAELGLFEISMRLSERATNLFPKADLRLAINDVHIRTCSDSAAALAKILLYLSNEGDLCLNDDQIEHVPNIETKSLNFGKGDSVTTEFEISAIPQEQQNAVSTLLIDAMKEVPDEAAGNIEDQNMESWYNEHENVTASGRESPHAIVLSSKRSISEEVVDQLIQVKQELGDTSNEIEELISMKKESKSLDDDFDLLSNESFLDYENAFDPAWIVDNHFMPHGKAQDLLRTPPDFPVVVSRYTLCEMSFIWHMFGGNDFEVADEKDKANNDDCMTITFPEGNMSEVYKTGVSFSKGSPSTFKNGRSMKTWRKQGGCGRNHRVEIELVVNKVRMVHENYPTDVEQASRQVLLITDIEILDKVKTSDMNKFLYCEIDAKARSSKHMVSIQAIHSRTNSSLECAIKMSILPLRLNVDQDSLLFIINYIRDINNFAILDENSISNIQVPAVYQPPIMTVDIPEACRKLEARKQVLNGMDFLKDDAECSHNENDDSQNDVVSPLYIKSFTFAPELQIRFDYQGKRVDLSHGPIAGLCMGLGQLNCSKITLKQIHFRHGLLGIDKLFQFLLKTWLNDIKKNQLPHILGGVGPMNSFIKLFQGIFDLVWLPVHQYQKDGRIVKGLHLGCQSFTAHTTLAVLEITSRLIHIIQFAAETIYDMLSSGPSLKRRHGHHGKRKRLHPPQDIREGVSNAYHIMKDGLGDTANQIVDMAVLEHDQKGTVGAVGAVLRQIPPSAVRPIVLVSQATSNVLGGVKNQLIPEARREARQKWKSEE